MVEWTVYAPFLRGFRRDDTRSVYSEVRIFTVTGLFRFALSRDCPYLYIDKTGLWTSYNRIIYFGAIYASGVTGLKKTVAKLTQGQELFVITVGMVDPADQAFIGPLREALKKLIPPQMYDEKRIFHLRGAIDYSQLELKYRILMKMMYSQASKLPEEKLTSEFKAVLATYGKKVDYVDLEMLRPLTAALRQS